MTGYNSQVGNGRYRIQLETDNKECYDAVQSTIREYLSVLPEKTRKKLERNSKECEVNYGKYWKP